MTALSELVHVSANVFQKRAFRLFRRAFAAHKPDPDRFARFILFPGRFPAVSFLPVCGCVSFPVFVLTVSRLKPAEYGFSSSPRRLQRFLKHARRSEAAASLFLRFLRVSPRDASGAFPGGLSMF